MGRWKSRNAPGARRCPAGTGGLVEHNNRRDDLLLPSGFQLERARAL